MKTSGILIVTACLVLGGLFFVQHDSHMEALARERSRDIDTYHTMKEAIHNRYRDMVQDKASTLFDSGCQEVEYTQTGDSCLVADQCFTDQYMLADLLFEPVCTNYGIVRIQTPESVRGIYMTSLAAGSTNFRNRLIELVESTELNTIVIDIKEIDGYTGTPIGNSEQFPFQSDVMGDVRELIEDLHERDIYVIARIVLFKDAAWVDAHPDQAVQRKDNRGVVWTDYGGKKFIDPGATPFWDYLVELSSATYNLGFDEIQADYIRYPSDGQMSNTYYPYSQDTIDELGPMNGRVATLNEFAEYYTTALRERHPEIVISADVFGMVTSLDDDLTIGQTLEPFLEHFDYVSPMVYPSHYGTGFVSLPGHPDNHPYEVVKKAMDDGVRKANNAGINPDKLRPWLQDFTCTWCAGYFPYGADEVREQIQATYDAGLDSWILWNAANRYTRGGLLGQ